MEVKKELEYQQLVKYIDERHADGIPYRKALDEVYKFYKPWHETDFRVRTMLVKLKKNLDIPLAMNKHESKHFKYQANNHSNRTTRKRHEKDPEIMLASKINSDRDWRIKNVFWLDPEKSGDRDLYNSYLAVKRDLTGKAKKVFSKSISNREGLTLTQEHIEMAKVAAKDATSK